MRAIALLYHDVVPPGCFDASGFQGPDADIYKLDCGEFGAHLAALARSARRPPSSVLDLPARPEPEPLLLTFDDGGAGALYVSDLLGEYGWTGHFFIATDRIGTPGFLYPAQIRELRRRGHVIGSHSCSHPLRMARCADGELDREWRQSARALADILGEPVEAASVPGGYYSRRVASAAARAGIRLLFNSEPVTRWRVVDGCLVAGRFAVQRGAAAEWAAAVAGGARAPRLRQYLYWNLKKLFKRAGGENWLRVRRFILERRDRR